MSGKRVPKEKREAIVADIKARIKSFRQIGRDHSVSQSTVSAIAKEEGISPTRKRKRTAAAKDVEGTYSRAERVAVADKALSALDELIASGGLNPREMREATQALKQTLDARRAEDLPSPEGEASAHGRSFAGNAPTYGDLVSLHNDGTPKNIAALFSLRDIETARILNDPEGEENAMERLKLACRAAGLSHVDIPLDAMISMADAEHEARYPSAPASPEDAEAPEYQGEGRS
jgi:transposase-like protein